MKYQLSRGADKDLDAIAEHSIRVFGLAQTEVYLGGLSALFDLLSHTPSLGAVWKGDIRRHPYQAHMVYYRLRKADVLILRVRGARMKEPKVS